MATLYHGTSSEAYEAILESGFSDGFVFLTPSLEIALEYGEEVLEVTVADDDLLVDLDQGASAVSLSSANKYYGEVFDVDDYLSRGQSMAVNSKSIMDIAEAI